jgi:hypothetical protein
VHALFTQIAFALATLVPQTFPHPPQLLASVDVFTHEPEQSAGALGGQVATHVEFEHTLGLHPLPQVPQLFWSLVVSTHAPLQSE